MRPNTVEENEQKKKEKNTRQRVVICLCSGNARQMFVIVVW